MVASDGGVIGGTPGVAELVLPGRATPGHPGEVRPLPWYGQPWLSLYATKNNYDMVKLSSTYVVTMHL